MTLLTLVTTLSHNETIIIDEGAGCTIYEGTVRDFLATLKEQGFGEVEELITSAVDTLFINNGKLVIVLA